MNEMIKFWLTDLYKEAIAEAHDTIMNEHVWELGYDGDELNPHTGNIETLKEYIEVLEEKMEEIK